MQLVESEQLVPTSDGIMPTFAAAPDARGAHPAVIVLMDAPGVRGALRDVARRIATAGFTALLPDLYYRSGRGIQFGPTRDHPEAEANRKRMMAMVATLNNDSVARDVQALLDWCAHSHFARAGAAALVGYCMSGAFAVCAAARCAERVACTASYFGTRLVTERTDSPHLLLPKIRGELYFSFAEDDPYVTPAQVEALRAHLDSSGAHYILETYEDSHHGFVFPDRGNYHEASAARHWRTLSGLLERNLTQ